ncbi:hypothetical protein HYV87_03510 [Candidatus Woesearchaeota archaeon]|nr:hypothetical protein [Candidatus Woesearchaeota archaeon]MBI2582163.1 hypothetical protein [Candidatus Woesearchaeota archaeon]
MEANHHQVSELRTEFREKKKEFSMLRSQLASIHAEKEEYFRQLRSAKESIKSALAKINSIKQERDNLTKKVQELKQERNKLNLVMQEKFTHKKEADQKKKELTEKAELKGNPSRIKAIMAQLEHQLETEVMPFPEEEKIRKKIKLLQVDYKRLTQLGEISKDIHNAAVEAAEHRRKAQQSHQEVQDTAILSQNKHEQLTALYQELNQLREKEKSLAQKYFELKNQHEQMKKPLEETFSRVKELGKIFSDEEKKSFSQQIKEKTAEVQEKIKKRQKLRTEDILAFQALDKN